MTAFLRRYRHIVSETAWVFFSQGLAALATLLGVRLLTEVVPPEVYGGVALALGVVALAQGLAVGPLMQAVLRLFPDLAREGRETDLRIAAVRALRRPVAVALVLLAACAVGWAMHWPQDRSLVLPLMALFLVEVVRSFEITFLNAARRQRDMALLTIADAWARPIAAVALVWVFGPSSTAVIGGYLAGCTLALAGFWLRGAAPKVTTRSAAGATIAVDDLSHRLWAYAWPLAALPLIGWVSGQADRYLVGGFAGVAAAGLYAALYGLASKPFLMLSASVELALRQPFYGRVSAGDRIGAVRALAVWLGSVIAAAATLFFLFVSLHELIAHWLLAAEYRAQSSLMGWVAAGYVLLCVAQVLERVCYACHDTRGVALVQAAGALASIVIAAPLVWRYGIAGAAWAVPVYFGLQLLLTVWRARRAWRTAFSVPAKSLQAPKWSHPRQESKDEQPSARA
jgi:O-antigen/teichoic acid export membrane protein